VSTAIADLIMGQRRSLDALAEIIEKSAQGELYPLRWTVLPTALYAEVPRFEADQSDTDRRAIFDAWCQALAATAPKESKWFDGGLQMGVELRAVFTHGGVPGSLVLFIQTQD
jgi:hypothetical protein